MQVAPSLLPEEISRPALQQATVVANELLCRDHYRLTLLAESFPQAAAGQFVHVSPVNALSSEYVVGTYAQPWAGEHARDLEQPSPLIRRAFSIASLERVSSPNAVNGDRPRSASAETPVRLSIIHRVVGVGTRWLASLAVGDGVSLLGPLGRPFPIHKDKPRAWLVAGGVGLPPMLWLAESLRRSGRESVVFSGAQTTDLIPLTLDHSVPPDPSAREPRLCSVELARSNTPMILSTDDGSIGFKGHVGRALETYAAHNTPALTSPLGSEDSASPASELVVYTCGPERMMRFVAEWCAGRGILCYVCMEREMACAMATCQSCVVPVKSPVSRDGWRYALCCREGPVFESSTVLWDDPQRR